MKVKKLSSEYISDHKYFTARKDAYETPTGKIVSPYFVVEMPASACAVAVTTDNEILLVEQYRYPIDRECLELPGGFIDENEAPENAIVRELAEETGYSFEQVYYLGTTYANPGVLNNTTHLFLATGGKKTGEQSLDPNEEIRIHIKPVAEVKQMVKSGKIKQSMHEACIRRAFEHSAMSGF